MTATSADDDASSYGALLDWPEVLGRLAERAQSARGAESCAQLPLAGSAEEATQWMADVTEMATLMRTGEPVPGLAFAEIEAHLDAVQTGVPLGAEELKQVAALCEVAESVRRAFSRYAPDAVTKGPFAPRLAAIAGGLGVHRELVYRARETFDAAGELRDSASPALMGLRRERDQMASRTRELMEGLLTSEEYAPYLQDQFVTLREDRFVLPLRASFKSMGLGIVHDTSRSGETVFVEPTRAVELNNRLKVAEIEIRRESRRILEELAAMVAAEAPSLRSDRDILVRLDVIAAKARLSVDCDATPIDIVQEPVVDVRELRHPLLALRAKQEGKHGGSGQGGRRAGSGSGSGSGAGSGSGGFVVTANDLALGKVAGKSEARVLVVSGPNAGGKTVLLKSVGLAALLARAGMHVPAAPGSRIGFFHRVLADIGDQQSIMGDLSTFSAHLANVASIVQRVGEAAADEHLMVLCDELMTGTHPEQGAALARAVLETLARAPGLVITTTHYDSLKALAESDDRFRNAGMEYDLANLRPTFRLKDGLPGRSYALDIAARLGLSDAILARARELVGATTLGLEEVLRDLEQREEALARASEGLEAARLDLEDRASDQKDAADALTKREKELARRSREAVDAAVREARRAIDDIVSELRKTRTMAAAQSARQALEKKAVEVSAGLPEPPALDVDKLREALASRALGVGGKKSTASAGATAGGRSAPADDGAIEALRTRGNSADVRGMRADEALREVQAFLDRVVLDGADTLFIIHGHGTGALRRVVREYLATSPYVERFRAGAPREGGDGVSVVTVKG